MIRSERRENGIVWITIDRPQARNAMTFAMWEELGEIARALNADESVRVVAISGAGGKAFVSGTDISEFRNFNGNKGLEYEVLMDRAMASLDALRMPLIAVIGGVCTGGGAAIASASDVRVGAPGTTVGAPIARTLGNVISLRNCARLANLIGLDAVKFLILTGRLIDAETALRLGFLNDMAPSDAGIEAHAYATALSMSKLAPLTLAATKEMCRRFTAATPLPAAEDLIRLCYGSNDFRAGVEGFLNKTPVTWTGT
jgi:enoyl-CoA hydratase